MNFILSTMMALLIATMCNAQTAEQIIQKHLKSRGLESSYKNLKTMKFEGTLQDAGDTEIHIMQTIVFNKAIRYDITVKGQTGYIIATKTDGWMFLPFVQQTKPKPLDNEILHALQLEMELPENLFAEYERRGYHATINEAAYTYGTGDSSEIDGIKCYWVTLTDKKGWTHDYYFDIENYLLVSISNQLSTNSDYFPTDKATNFAWYIIGNYSSVVSSNKEGIFLHRLYGQFKKIEAGIEVPHVKSLGINSPKIKWNKILVNEDVNDMIFKRNK